MTLLRGGTHIYSGLAQPAQQQEGGRDPTEVMEASFELSLDLSLQRCLRIIYPERMLQMGNSIASITKQDSMRP